MHLRPKLIPVIFISLMGMFLFSCEDESKKEKDDDDEENVACLNYFKHDVFLP